jgi:hypothetical protein
MTFVALNCLAARPPPNPTNTLTNASATNGGDGGGDSAAVAVTITTEASHKWRMMAGAGISPPDGRIGLDRPHQTIQITQQSIGIQAGVCRAETCGVKATIS